MFHHLADDADVHRNAYNAAFQELGLSFYWDTRTYQTVQCNEGERACLKQYLEAHQPHLLKAYDVDFLVNAIHAAKARCYDNMTAEGCNPKAYINWAELRQTQVGI
jgi:hypothetical protein